MADIRSFIKAHLLEPLKQYNTIIQDTMIEIITQRLQELYEYAVEFPEILSPGQSRLDILKAIADQFLFTVRDEGDVQEQANILENILYVYTRRGSIDTIENMWKYYGGSLPKGVKVIIPSYNLFRYSISAYSETDRYLDGSYASIIVDPPVDREIAAGSFLHKKDSNLKKAIPMIIAGSTSILLTNTNGLSVGDEIYIGGVYEGKITQIPKFRVEERNSPGMYEIRLTNNTYPIPELKEFLVNELVAAGNYIYFTNALHMNVAGDLEFTNHYDYKVTDSTFLHLELFAPEHQQGFILSGYNPMSPNPSPDIYDELFSPESIADMTMYRNPKDSLWSGRENIFLELSTILEVQLSGDRYDLLMNAYRTYNNLGVFILNIPLIDIEESYQISIRDKKEISMDSYLYCTPTDLSHLIARYLYSRQGDPIETNYPGYFVFGETLLGTEIENIS